jgi:hypothetical protein
MFIRILCGAFSALCGLFLFSNHTHVWVPISLSPLVAFAPAGDRKMGTQSKEAVDRERSGGREQRKTVGWKEQNFSFARVRGSMAGGTVLVRTP